MHFIGEEVGRIRGLLSEHLPVCLHGRTKQSTEEVIAGQTAADEETDCRTERDGSSQQTEAMNEHSGGILPPAAEDLGTQMTEQTGVTHAPSTAPTTTRPRRTKVIANRGKLSPLFGKTRR